ncbi:MAG TPA: hypothetical protein PKG54_14825 [Phycisphaerae bacterium]|jgi:hypothetical protein|nr:hypothetical protein [Phycisphaerae bacterium]HOB75788.1 hypothetical protein [Phycisphaerae bacterium]HOJ55580.1 hypothetical protein [Phycisphaerae bacterium]HOL27724.1 hypothetical protein [Phycisphaerae bacterium]HPP21894.1 hypothetical protein [Phycisphaerae bacterium]
MTAVEIPPNAPRLARGDRVRITQMILGRDLRWPTTVEGVVESFKPEPTGSWYAHGKGDKLWLLRVRLRKDDGEITTLTLDAHSTIEVLNRQ